MEKTVEKFLREGGQKNNEGKNSIDKKLCFVFLFFFILRWEKQSLLAFRWERPRREGT